MRQYSNRLGALALALTATLSIQSRAGVIMISTRAPQDTQAGTEFVTDEKGPGMVTPGDVAMASALSDNGYSCRLILDKLLGAGAGGFGQDAQTFLQPTDPNMAVSLIIMSGSGGSTDTPPPPPGVPLMMGEHVCLGNRTDRPGSVFMYNGQNSNDPNESTTPAVSKYMKVLLPDHPIMAGIPLDAQGRVKIFRERYPDEEAHVPTGGKKNYEFRWCTQVLADKAQGTTVIGVLDGAEDRTCFAVVDKGGILADGNPASARLVQMFLNENGSGGSRRVFNALTEWGQLIFVRAAKWAMGETLAPVKSIRITDIKSVGAQSIKVSWEGSAKNNYKFQASTDFGNWMTVGNDVIGADGIISQTLELGSPMQTLFLRIRAMP